MIEYIYEYFMNNVSKEEMDKVIKTYIYEFEDILNMFEKDKQDTFTKDEVKSMFIRIAMERDLDLVKVLDDEYGGCSNESTKERYMKIIDANLIMLEEENGD